MSETSKYRLQKRIKELEAENKVLQRYRIAFRNIFTVACDCADENKHVKNSYILRQGKDVME